MSYDIRFLQLRQPIASMSDIKMDDIEPISDTVAAVRARLDALFPGGVTWSDETHGTPRDIPWVEWQFSPLEDETHVTMVTLSTSFRMSDEEREALVQRVADETGWTALDLQRGAKRDVIAPRATATR